MFDFLWAQTVIHHISSVKNTNIHKLHFDYLAIPPCTAVSVVIGTKKQKSWNPSHFFSLHSLASPIYCNFSARLRFALALCTDLHKCSPTKKGLKNGREKQNCNGRLLGGKWVAGKDMGLRTMTTSVVPLMNKPCRMNLWVLITRIASLDDFLSTHSSPPLCWRFSLAVSRWLRCVRFFARWILSGKSGKYCCWRGKCIDGGFKTIESHWKS